MTEQPGRGGLGPAHSSETVGDRGTAGVGGGVGGPRRPRALGVGVGGAGAASATAGPSASAGHSGMGGEDERTQLRAVMRDFGPAWEIERVPPGAAWVAVTRRGSWVHVIAAHDLDTLRTKIEAAELEDTAPAPAPSPTSYHRHQLRDQSIECRWNDTNSLITKSASSWEGLMGLVGLK